MKNNILFSYFIVLVGLVSLSACTSTEAQVLTPEGQAIRIELAMTPEEQMQGLMFREHLDENAGMLFVFEEARPLSFWMKNTLIPLDVLYLDASGKIVDIHTMEPCPADSIQCPSYPSQAEAKYALEINAGRAGELELEVGDQLRLQIPQRNEETRK